MSTYETNSIISLVNTVKSVNIEPSFIEMLEEGGLINVRTEAGKHYLLVLNFRIVERIVGCTMTYPSIWKALTPFIICWKEWTI